MTDADTLGERLAKKLAADRAALVDVLLGGVSYDQYLGIIGEVRGIRRAEAHITEAVKLMNRDGDLE